MPEIEPVVYHGHLVEVLEDGRWRYGGLTFETADDCRYYLDSLPPKEVT